MSAPLALDKIKPGFADPVRESQTAFRKLMDAVARPGTRARFDGAVATAGGTWRGRRNRGPRPLGL